MKALIFYLFSPFILLFSRLPLKILYFFSDFILYPLLYKILGYRKKIVKKNLQNAFPELPEVDRLKIEKKFYRFLSDLFVETIKSFSISSKELAERVIFENPEVLSEIYAKNKSMIFTLGHMGNYEWLALIAPDILNINMLVPYRKINNPYFDKFFKKSRERGGATLFHTRETNNKIEKQKQKFVVGLANDQSAPAEKSFWTKFLNQDTSFFEGTEKLARELDLSVIFIHVSVKVRGRYSVKFEIITENPKEESIGSILEKHARLLESDIKNAPEYWLWSHKRWKHKKPPGLEWGFARDLF